MFPCVCVSLCAWTGAGSSQRKVCVLLRLGQVLSDDLLGLWWDPVGEAHRELHDEVATLRRVLGKGQALPPQPLGRAWLDDVVARQRDDAVLQRGNADRTAAQSLQRETRAEGLATVWGRTKVLLRPSGCHQERKQSEKCFSTGGL